MTLQQWSRREELREQLSDLVMQMAALGRAAEGQNTSLFQWLDQQREEKSAELKALNALYNDPAERRELKWYLLVRDHHDILRFLRMFSLAVLLMLILMAAVDWRGGSAEGFGIFALIYACVSLVWLSYLLHRYRPE